MSHQPVESFVRRAMRCLAFALAATLTLAPLADAQHRSVNYRGGSAAKTRFGYIDRQQKLVIPAQYDSAGDFSEGAALVFQEARWRMIDTMGTLLGDVPDSLKLVSDVHGGVLRVKTPQGAFGYLKLNGSWALAPQFTKASDFSEGLALVEATGKTGPVCEIINRTGKVVAVIKVKLVECKEVWADRGWSRAFASGRVAVRAEPDAGAVPSAANVVLLDTLGRLAVKTRYFGLSRFSEGLGYADRGHDGPGAYIDRDGKVVIDSVDDGGAFSEGFAFSSLWTAKHDSTISHRHGIISKAGKWMTRPGEYSFAVSPFRGGTAWVYDYSEQYLVDTLGTKTKFPCCEAHGMSTDGMVVVHWKDLPEYVFRYIDLATGRFGGSEDLYGSGGDFFNGRAAFAAIIALDSVKQRVAARIARLAADAALYAPKPAPAAPAAAKPVVVATKPGLWAWWVVRQGIKEFSDKGRQIWVDYMLFDAETGPTPEKLEAQARIPSRSLAIVVKSGAMRLSDDTGENAPSEILAASKLRLRVDMVSRVQLDRVSNNRIGRVKYQP